MASYIYLYIERNIQLVNFGMPGLTVAMPELTRVASLANRQCIILCVWCFGNLKLCHVPWYYEYISIAVDR